MNYPEFITDRYRDQVVHVVGSGPSLTAFDYSYFRGRNVIAVNHAYKLTPHDFCVFIDRDFPTREDPEIFKKTWTVSRHDIPGVRTGFKMSKTFSLDPAAGVYPQKVKSAGASALTIALQAGPARIYLWGFDCRFLSPAEVRRACTLNGAPAAIVPDQPRGHSTSNVFPHRRDTPEHEGSFTNTVQVFEPFPRDRVFNCSEFSALPFFPYSPAPP